MQDTQSREQMGTTSGRAWLGWTKNSKNCKMFSQITSEKLDQSTINRPDCLQLNRSLLPSNDTDLREVRLSKSVIPVDNRDIIPVTVWYLSVRWESRDIIFPNRSCTCRAMAWKVFFVLWYSVIGWYRPETISPDMYKYQTPGFTPDKYHAVMTSYGYTRWICDVFNEWGFLRFMTRR